MLDSQGSSCLARMRRPRGTATDNRCDPPGFVGWEEKDESKEFVLVRLEKQEAVFLQRHTAKTPWMIYRLENAQTLVAYFEVEHEAVTDADRFFYTRLAVASSQ